jgi:hypothetical protein
MKHLKKIMRSVMSWIKTKIILLSLVTFSCIFGIFIIEVGLRVFNFNDEWKVTKQANVLRNYQFSYDISNLYTSDITSVNYVRNEFGLRDSCASTQDIEILTIGGSTTDQRYVPFESTYQSILEQRIREVDSNFGCVTNAGVDGHSTWGHLFAFENWFPLIPSFKPKFVILYVGVNDADFNRTSSPNPFFDNNDAISFQRFLKRFEVVRAVLPIYQFLQQRDANSSAAYSGHAPKPYQENDYTVMNINNETERLAANNKAAFRLRMNAILDQIQNLEAIPICVTQPHRYVINKGGQLYGIPNVLGEGFSGIDYDFSLRELNSVMMELCGDLTVDLYNHNFSSNHFYDGIHTTDMGSEEIGETIADFFIAKFY